MAIRFACPCGKRLKAPNRMRGRWTECPTCSESVQIPGSGFDSRSAKPAVEPITIPAGADFKSITQSGRRIDRRSGTSAPNQRSRKANGNSTFVPARSQSNGDAWKPNSIALRHSPKWYRLLRPQRERSWYHSLLYPLDKVPGFCRLAACLTVLTGLALIGWISIDRGSGTTFPYHLFTAALVALFFVLGHTFNYFNAVISLAAEGKIKQEPGLNAGWRGAVLGFERWMECLVAGPVLLFAAAFGYWTYSGDLTLIDWVILAELAFAGMGWWFIALLVTNVDGVRIASPRRILNAGRLLGWKTVELTLLAAAVFLGHFLVAAYGIAALHHQPLSALPLLCLCWTSGLYLTAFTFRRLGVTYHRRLAQRERASLASVGSRELFRPAASLSEGQHGL